MNETTNTATNGTAAEGTAAAVSTEATNAAAATTTEGAATTGDEGKTTEQNTTATTETKTETQAPVVPDKYDLKLPADSTLDPAIVQRTADTARALGLSNEAGQKMLDFAAAERSAAVQEYEAARQPGGAEWTRNDEALRTAALADKEIGGSPEKLAASVALGQQVVTKFAGADADEFKAFLNKTGLGSSPVVLRFLSRIGKGMSEGSLVMGGTNDGGGDPEQAKLDRMYPSMAKKG